MFNRGSIFTDQMLATNLLDTDTCAWIHVVNSVAHQNRNNIYESTSICWGVNKSCCLLVNKLKLKEVN
jgi:hypothetical protein